MAKMSVPLLNRLVDRMFDYADPKADQNIWNLARAAEEVLKETKVDEFFRTGDPSHLTEKQRKFQERFGAVGVQPSPTGRMQVAPVPLTFSTDPAQGFQAPVHVQQNVDYAARLGVKERELQAISELLAGEPEAVGPTLYERVQSVLNARHAERRRLEFAEGVVKTAEGELIRSGSLEMHGSIEQRITNAIRNAAYNDSGRERAEKRLRDLAHTLSPTQPISMERLSDLAEGLVAELTQLREDWTAKSRQIEELRAKQEQQGTLFEEASAERMRKLLGAQTGESLAAAAIRVKGNSEAGWNRVRELENQHEIFETAIRELVGARDMFEDDDTYVPREETLDAVRRIATSQSDEGLEYQGPRYEVKCSDGDKDYWAVWDKKTGDWFVSVDVGSKGEAERRAAGLNESEDEE